MDIIIPFKNMEGLEDEILKNANDLNGWTDVGMDDILGRNLNLNDLNLK